MATTTNTNKATTTTTTTTKVCAHKLSKCLAEWENIEMHNASALASWVAIGLEILSEGSRGLQAAFVEKTGANKGDVSTAVTIARAFTESQAGDEEYDWQDFSALAQAGRAARAYLKGEDAPEPKSRAKASGVSYKAQDVVKTLGKAKAKALALEILASL